MPGNIRLMGVIRFLAVLIVALPLSMAKAGERASGSTPFSLTIKGGLGSFTVGDLNTTLASLDSYYWWLREVEPDHISGSLLKIPSRFNDWEVELGWAALRGLSVGLTLTGPVGFHDRCSVSYIYSTEASTYAIDSNLHVALSIGFGLTYSIPVFANLNLQIKGGINSYRARISQTHEWLDRFLDGTQRFGEYHYRVEGDRIGYLCGCNIEHQFSKQISMIAEAHFRFARLGSLAGNSELSVELQEVRGSNIISTEHDSQEGFLYHYIVSDWAGYPTEELGIYSDPSTIADEVSDLRKARLDLGGARFRIGLKIRLF